MDFAEFRNGLGLMGRKLLAPGLFGTTEVLDYFAHFFVVLQFVLLQLSLLFTPVVNQVCSI